MENVGPRSATLRPHIPRRGVYGFAAQKGGNSIFGAHHGCFVTVISTDSRRSWLIRVVKRACVYEHSTAFSVG